MKLRPLLNSTALRGLLLSIAFVIARVLETTERRANVAHAAVAVDSQVAIALIAVAVGFVLLKIFFLRDRSGFTSFDYGRLRAADMTSGTNPLVVALVAAAVIGVAVAAF